MEQRPIPHPVIVGAGPAGLGAAVQLAEHGVGCTVIDENPRIGGVVYRGPSRRRYRGSALDPGTLEHMRSLGRDVARHRDLVELRLETEVVGPTGDNRLHLLARGRLEELSYRQLILSCGCYERTVPFPGWTLPGVMTVGGAQLQVKTGLVRPASRMVLVGSGPLLVVAAAQLHRAGVEVVGVYEAARRTALLRAGSALLGNPGQLRQGLWQLAYLRRHRVPFHFGWGIVRAAGDTRLQRVHLAPYRRDWSPDRRRAVALDTDGLAVGYGYVPRTQLAQLLGVEHRDHVFGGVQPRTDAWRRTSVSGTYAAGDGAGVFGAEAAALQGRIAALAILLDLGRIDAGVAETLVAPLRRRLDRVQRCSRALLAPSVPRPGLLELAEADTIVCRCENVTRERLDAVVARGVTDLTTLKMTTRAGMGDCQGKLCGEFCRDYLRRRTGQQQVGEFRPRFPLAPVPFEALLGESCEEV